MNPKIPTQSLSENEAENQPVKLNVRLQKPTERKEGDPRVKHGHATSKEITPEFCTWMGIKSRCFYPKNTQWERYGGRGITMCDRWKNDFLSFYEDVGPKPSPKHSIDRIDNNGNYEPGNVRWVTIKEQNRNKSNNYNITWNGVTKCVADWGQELVIKQLGIRAATIYDRIRRRGWTVEKTFTTPLIIRSKL